jgi:DNA modification methylase
MKDQTEKRGEQQSEQGDEDLLPLVKEDTSVMPKPYYQDRACTIYQGDCREILPMLGRFDLVLTDPPYGINYESNLPGCQKFGPITGDEAELDLSHIFKMHHDGSGLVVFGANNFPRQLPFGGRWICWDKRVNPKADAMLGSPFELAWCNEVSGFNRIIRLMHGGVVNQDRKHTDRVHPTQKPVGLMRIILTWYSESKKIVDPYMGSGTTLVAAKSEGRNAVGIEIEERYCEAAAKRLRQEVLDL